MQRIRGLCSCIYRLIFLALILHEIHSLQHWQDLFYGVRVVQLPFQIPVYDKGNKAGNKVGHDSVLTFQIYRTCFKVCLHYSETFLNLPATLVRFYYSSYAVIEICAHCIETIIFFFDDG